MGDGWMGRVGVGGTKNRRREFFIFFWGGVALSRRFLGPWSHPPFWCQRLRTRNRVKVWFFARGLNRDAPKSNGQRGGVGFGGSSPARCLALPPLPSLPSVPGPAFPAPFRFRSVTSSQDGLVPSARIINFPNADIQSRLIVSSNHPPESRPSPARVPTRCRGEKTVKLLAGVCLFVSLSFCLFALLHYSREDEWFDLLDETTVQHRQRPKGVTRALSEAGHGLRQSERSCQKGPTCGGPTLPELRPRAG